MSDVPGATRSETPGGGVNGSRPGVEARESFSSSVFNLQFEHFIEPSMIR
jgi:hypothetical protein